MLKIYSAFGISGNVELKKGIQFEHGRFDTGSDGYGDVFSGNLSCEKAIYSLQYLYPFLGYLNSIKTEDGYINHGHFTLFNPHFPQKNQ